MFRRSFLLALGLLMWTVGCGGSGPAGGGGGGGGGGPRTFKTPAALLTAAAPVWEPSGATEQVGSVTFKVPAGWQEGANGGGAVMESPPDRFGATCMIAVEAPRPVATGEEARYAQALEAASALLVEPGDRLTDDFEGPDPLSRASRGVSGNGWDYRALTMRLIQADGSVYDVLSLVARFGSQAVPVIAVEPMSTLRCVSYNGEFGVDVANVLYSLDLGSPVYDHALESSLIGEWFSSDGSAGNLYVFGANGHYIDASAVGGVVEVTPGEWRDRYASWAGTGGWASVGDTLAFFPTGGQPTGHFATHFEVRDFSGVWQESLCWTDAYAGEPYMYCTRRQE